MAIQQYCLKQRSRNQARYLVTAEPDKELQKQTARRKVEGEVKQKLPTAASSLPLLADVFYLNRLP